MKTDRLYEKYYFRRPEFVDGTTEFHNVLSARITRGCILEIGSGPTNETTRYLASLAPVVGVDVTEEVNWNGALAESYVFDGVRLPFPDDCFNTCVSNWVVEHVEQPEAHFFEVARVLRPGGVYCFRTPNLWHYFTLGSRLLPHAAHVHVANRLRGMAKGSHDPYPTYYRANTAKRIQHLASRAGLLPLHVVAIEKEPSYGRFHPALFYSMLLYERLVNSMPALEMFRASLIAVLAKREHN